MAEARLENFGSGLSPVSGGWFVVNVRDAEWWFADSRGAACWFESEYGDPPVEFEQLGINITVLEPGQRSVYHAESNQEAFLVLAGECGLLVEGEERRLRRWDFFHSAPWTEHAFVGAGDGPCAILMAGARLGPEVRYPVSELAARYGASVAKETSDPEQAYATAERFRRERPPSWSRLPWAGARTGGCLCGAVRYSVRGDPLHVRRCHCANCRKESGSAFTVFAHWPVDAFELSGELLSYDGRGFCPRCGSRILDTAGSDDTVVEIRIGSLDDAPFELEPEDETWVKRRESWIPAVDGATQHDEGDEAR